MNCRDFEPLIYLYREGELTDTEKTLLTRHLEQCDSCRELHKEAGQLEELVDLSIQSDPFPGSIDLRADIMGQLDEEDYFSQSEKKEKRASGNNFINMFIKTAVAASILVFTFQAGSMLNSRKLLEEKMSTKSRLHTESRSSLKNRFARLLNSGTAGLTHASVVINPEVELRGEEVVISEEDIKNLLSEYLKLKQQQDRFIRALKEIVPELSELKFEDGINRSELHTIFKNRDRIKRAIRSW